MKERNWEEIRVYNEREVEGQALCNLTMFLNALQKFVSRIQRAMVKSE